MRQPTDHHHSLPHTYTQTQEFFLSEFGSLQLEFAALARATGNETYNELAEAPLKKIFDCPKRPGGKADGLFQSQWSASNGDPSNGKVGTGAGSDSFYEYLLKARGGRGEMAGVELGMTTAVRERRWALLVGTCD